MQDPEFLPVGPFAGGLRVAGMQRGSGFAEVAGDVDEVDEHRHFQAAGPGVVADGGDLLLVPVDEEHPLPDAGRVAEVAFVVGGADHRRGCLGDGRRDPLVTCDGAGMGVAAGLRGGDVLGLADGGGEVGDRDDLGHLLDPRMSGISLALSRYSGRIAMPLPSAWNIITSLAGSVRSAAAAR